MKVICKKCKEYKELMAKGLCSSCYQKEWRKDNPKKTKGYDKKRWIENKETRRKIHKKWYVKNQEKVKIKAKKWRKNNLEKVKAARKKYKINYPEKIKEGNKKYRIKNSEKIKEQQRKYSIKNSEKTYIRVKKYRIEHPEWSREQNFKRRVNGQTKKGIINQILNENIFKYGEIVCEKCKEKCPDNYHIDHIIPVIKGGSNDYDNLQILCADCNHKKFTKTANYKQNIKDSQVYLREVL